MNSAQWFSARYALQRNKFLGAVSAGDAVAESLVHPLQGRDGEILAMDVARFGSPDASRLLIVTSGTHGLEGFCGSGAQLAMIAHPTLHARARAARVAILYVHGVNPWGFSWLRRWTHENVDLNRNCIDFSVAGLRSRSSRYGEIADLLVPPRWRDEDADIALMAWLSENGMEALQCAVQGGQSSHPDGLFYRGDHPTWSNLAFRSVLEVHAQRCARVAMIDLHTGLGPCGVGERILLAPDDEAGRARGRAWWGKITSIEAGDSSSAPVSGTLCSTLLDECPQAEVTAMALEFGTVPPLAILDALRADQWLGRQVNPDPELRNAIKQQVLAAFYIDTDEWRRQVVDQTIDAAQAAIDGLAAA